jgi:hypothetical protein
MAKSKFDVHPSAYSNAYASKWYKKKGGTWRKSMLKEHNMPTFKEWIKNKS